jgi:hypothetical protein
LFLATAAGAQSTPADPLLALQQQMQTMQRQLAQQQREIGALRARVVQLQQPNWLPLADAQWRQRGKGYPTDMVGAQLLQGGSIAGLPATPAAPLQIAQAAAGAPQGQADAAADTANPALGTERQQTAAEARHTPAEVAAQGHAPQFHRKLTLTAGWNDTYYDRRQLSLSGFLALDAIFLGNISVGQTKAQIHTFDLAAQYGLSDDLSLNLDLPYVVRNSTFLSAGQNASSSAISEASVSDHAIGDVSFGFDWRLLREHENAPDVVASLKITAPTGTSPFGIALTQPDASNSNLQVPQRLPTGNGVWSINPSLSFLKTNDPIVLFGNVGYLYNVARNVGVIDPATIDSNGRVKLGDGFQLGGGFALVLNDRASVSTSVSGLFARSTKVQLPGQGWQTVTGSASTNVSLAFGVNYALSEHLTLSAALQAGLTPDAPNYALSLRFPYAF